MNYEEAKEVITDVVTRWCPIEGEPFEIQLMRVALNLSAFEKDVARIRNGQEPIRTDYPINLEVFRNETNS